MKRHVQWDLLVELGRDEASSRLAETEIAQPALFALQLGPTIDLRAVLAGACPRRTR